MDDLPIGRYGTIHYMSNNGSEIPLASYPIDEPVINFGRSDHNTCHIRIFDLWCSDIHCKVIFEDGKAFLVVLGQNGVVIDGSNFEPSSNEASPTTIPLTNGSEWLIYKRRFIFQYPPKDQRAKLLATPKPKSRKSLRMSMINAAQLWTPSAPGSGTGPKSQAESWRRLQSPVQPFPDGHGAAITIVEGNPVHLSHNQEEVVVVESVDSPEPEVAPPASARKTAQTPSKKGSANLHKQVLLMNSHRKHGRSIDEQEEREVEESILIEDDSDEELEEDAGANPFIGKSSSHTEMEVPIKTEEPEVQLNEPSLTAKSFRASLDAIGSVLPFGRPSGVVHSPAPQSNKEEEQDDQEMDLDADSERPKTPPNKRSLGGFFTPQVQRGEHTPQPRQSMGADATNYTDIDHDIEQARRRFAGLATVERPRVVDIAEDAPSQSRTVPRSVKKARLSLADVPELSSPMPSSFNMASISEQATGATEEDGEEVVDHTAARLQRLMRTVEKETRRESIRESRRSMANPVDFYSTAGSSPIKSHTSSEGRNLSSTAAFKPSSATHQAMHSGAVEPGEDSDTSAKDSEIQAAAKSRKGGKAPATGKRGAHKPEGSDDEMQLDEPEPAIAHEDAMMEDVEERPAKKARTTRKAKAQTPETAVPAPRVRRTKKAVQSMEDDNADEESPATEENTSVSVSRSRRGLRAESIVPETQPAKAAASTSTRRGAKAKPTPIVPEYIEDEPSGSSAEPVTAAKKGRRGKATKAAASEPVKEEETDEADVSAPPATAPARRATRGKAVHVEVVEEDSEQASEDASHDVPKVKATKAKAPARARKAAAVAKEDVSADSEPVATTTKKPAAKSTRKVAVKEEEVDASLDAKPRRTTRTKR